MSAAEVIDFRDRLLKERRAYFERVQGWLVAMECVQQIDVCHQMSFRDGLVNATVCAMLLLVWSLMWPTFRKHCLAWPSGKECTGQ